MDFTDSKEAEKLMRDISQIKLPRDLRNWIEKYDSSCGERNDFLWKWIYKLTTSRNPGIMLSCVPQDKAETVARLKVILSIFVIIVDDIADRDKDKGLLEELLKIPLEKKKSDGRIEDDRLDLAIKVWNHLEQNLKRLSRYGEFRKIFLYDLKQTLNSCRYSFLVNMNPELLNYYETKVYGSHNMILFLYTGIDLMTSPEFDRKDMPWLREMLSKAQQMTRIGNWISTWEREVKEDDFSSGVIAYALTEEIVDLADLWENNSAKIISKIRKKDLEERLLNEWGKKYKEIESFRDSISSVDIKEFLSGLKRIMKLHIASKGMK